MAQKVFFPYNMPLESSVLVDFHGISESAIIKGLELVKIDNTTVKVTAGSFYIVAANDPTKKFKIILDADENVNVSATSNIVYVTLTWVEDASMTAQIKAGSSTDSNYDLILGKCLFDTSNNLIGFDYTDRNELRIHDKVRRTVSQNLLINGSFEDWYYNSNKVLVPVGWVGNGTQSSNTGFSNKAIQLASGENSILQKISRIYVNLLKGNDIYLTGLFSGGGTLSLIFKDNTGTEIYSFSKVISTAEYQQVTVGGIVPDNTYDIQVQIKSSSGANLLADNIILTTSILNPEFYIGEEVSTENVEFLYFDTSNPPSEAVVSNSPVIVFPNSGISTAYFSFTYPSKFTSGMNVLLKMLTSISSETAGVAKFTINYTIIDEDGSISQSSSSINHLIDHGGSQVLKVSGVLLPTSSHSKNMIINVKITRDPSDTEDTLDANVYLFGIQLVEGGNN